jgi:FixJ family two-component response regulator
MAIPERDFVSREFSMAIISVVDDDQSLRLATIDLLNSAGFSCEAFGSAEVWLASANIAETACLILDIRMPGMSGLELQQRLAAMGHATPIIFVTAYPEERIRRQALSSGALCVLSKPFDDEELLDCIRLALARGVVGRER